MSKLGKEIVTPVLIIVVGVGWLLNVQGVISDVDWVWTCGLAAAGVLTLGVGGLNKLTAIVGPLLIVASVCSFLRQTGRMSAETEVPILTIALGVFMLIAQLSKLPPSELLKKAPLDPME